MTFLNSFNTIWCFVDAALCMLQERTVIWRDPRQCMPDSCFFMNVNMRAVYHIHCVCTILNNQQKMRSKQCGQQGLSAKINVSYA